MAGTTQWVGSQEALKKFLKKRLNLKKIKKLIFKKKKPKIKKKKKAMGGIIQSDGLPAKKVLPRIKKNKLKNDLLETLHCSHISEKHLIS